MNFKGIGGGGGCLGEFFMAILNNDSCRKNNDFVGL